MAKVALERKVKVEKGGNTRKASVRQVAFDRIGEKALSGDIRSMNFLLARETEEQPAVPDRWSVPPETAWEILRAYFSREKASKGKKS